MNEPSYKVFEDIEVKAKLLQKYWEGFREEIIAYLPDSYHEEIGELSRKLDSALETLLDELHNPTLILATTGTTSSGKSTLVNFLCGAEILPVAVSEMSAGAVSIEYSEETSLIIHETQNALWECGEWKNISGEEIRERLYDAMLAYIDNREEKPNLASPQITIYYPFRLLKESNLELPRGTKVRLLDLPGLSYVGDDGNASVIRQCREALCLVTYNSAETDRQKVKYLLQEVVEQVKDLGGSPARMLFILNRIDVFRSDREWPETETRFVENTVRSIKQELLEQLGEYKQEIESLQVAKLSTMPALLSLQIRDGDEKTNIYASKKAYREFNGLISENTLEDLPIKVEKWTEQDRERVASDLRAASYAIDFDGKLRNHITQHFPKLVIPQAIERFNSAAGNSVVEWSVQTTTAILNSSEEKYQQECDRIDTKVKELYDLINKLDGNLREPFNKMEEILKQHKNSKDQEKLSYKLEALLKELQNKEPYNQLGGDLVPLYTWHIPIFHVLQDVLGLVAKSLESGNINLDNLKLKKADPRLIELLKSNLQRLIKLGYTGELAKKGKIIEAKNDEERTSLKKETEERNIELKDLSMLLSLILSNVLKQEYDSQIKRLDESMQKLFSCYIKHSQKKIDEIAETFAIILPKRQILQTLEKVELKDVNFRSEVEFSKEGKTKENKGILRFFGFVPKIEYYTIDKATIPSTEKLLDNWRKQVGDIEYDMHEPVMDWLLKRSELIKQEIKTIQNEVLERYRTRLDTAYQDISLDYQQEKNIWQPLQQKALKLKNDFLDAKILS